MELQRAYRKAEAAHPRDDAPKVGSIRGLGLLDTHGDPESVLRPPSMSSSTQK